ncbi:hypothetical protein ACVBEQ_01710 [Nakamurella sp. GG22]
MTPTSTCWRFVRACVFAAVATQLAALGHVLGGGAFPDIDVLVPVTVLLGGSLTGFAGRRRSFAQIFGALAASQLLFHLAFTLSTHHGGSEGPPLPLGVVAGTGGMVAFHLLAALAASWVMTHGESTLFRLFAALWRVLVPARRPMTVRLGPSWTAVITGGAGGRLLLTGLGSLRSRRGPPLPS